VRRRRDFEIFSMSFLDAICCGFGAIILLFIIARTSEPGRLEQVRSADGLREGSTSAVTGVRLISGPSREIGMSFSGVEILARFVGR
jgi:hypothetical protein